MDRGVRLVFCRHSEEITWKSANHYDDGGGEEQFASSQILFAVLVEDHRSFASTN